jgi:hypothetical protein
MVQVGYQPPKAITEREVSAIARFRARVVAINPLVEVAALYGALFLIGWTWIPLAYVEGLIFWYVAGWAVVGFFLIWMIMISPAARKRGFEDLGFASHKSFAGKLNKVLKWGEKWNYMLIGGTVVAAYVIFMLNFVSFTDLIPVLGPLNHLLMENVPNSVFTFVLATVQFIFFAVITALFFFKTDNIKPSVKEYAKYGTPFLLLLFTLALATSERAYTETFMNVASNFLGYIYWALAQQVPTLVYVNTSAMEGLERSGIVKDFRRRQIISALITASIFAGIHIPAMPLSLIAFVMEFMIAMIYSFKKYRNVFAACLFHAMVGVIVVLLMQIDVTVGFMAFLP